MVLCCSTWNDILGLWHSGMAGGTKMASLTMMARATRMKTLRMESGVRGARLSELSVRSVVSGQDASGSGFLVSRLGVSPTMSCSWACGR